MALSTHYESTHAHANGTRTTTVRPFTVAHAAKCGEPAEAITHGEGLPLGKAQHLCSDWTRRGHGVYSYRAIIKEETK